MFTEKQKYIIQYDNRFKPRITLCEGAVRSGKSFINNWLFLNHVYSFKNKKLKFIITGHTIGSLQRNVLDDIEAFFHVDTRLNKRNEFELFGNTMACFGTDSTRSYKAMKGFTSYGWLGNEVTEHHPNSIDQGLKRCSGPGARIFWDTNPANQMHPIKINYVDKSGELLGDGRVHIKSHHFVLDDNEFLDSAYKESLKKSIPTGMWYDRDVLGIWCASEGIIFKDFNYSIHVIDKAPDYATLQDFFAGVDWGYDHFGVIGVYGVDHDGNVFRLYEIAEREKTVKEFWVDRALEIQNRHPGIVFYCDPARPDHIKDFRNAGIKAKEANNAVVEGITFCAGMLKSHKKYIVRDTNKLYLKEVSNYRWGLGERPIKEDDDAVDSDRYGCYSHLGHGKWEFVCIGPHGRIDVPVKDEQHIEVHNNMNAIYDSLLKGNDNYNYLR